MTKIENIDGEVFERGLYYTNRLPDILDKEYIKRCNYINNSSVMIHKTILVKCGEFNIGKNEDYDMWLRALCYTKCIYLKEPLVYYLTNGVKNYK